MERKIAIVGTGNVGSHLYKAISQGVREVEVRLFRSRGCDLGGFAPDTVLLCVADNAIGEVSRAIAGQVGPETVVAHTAGSVGMEALGRFRRRGVLYPLQTFSKGVELDYSRIPLFAEGSDPETLGKLMETGRLFTQHVREADSALRAKLHISAVFSCNFVNRLWALSDNLLRREGLDLEVLRPLLEVTLEKTRGRRPGDVQTGPAARRDFAVMQRHLDSLSGEEREIYQLLSRSIMSPSEGVGLM